MVGTQSGTLWSGTGPLWGQNMCLGVIGTCTVPWLTNWDFEKSIFKSNLPEIPTLDFETFPICCAPGCWLPLGMCHIWGD